MARCWVRELGSGCDAAGEMTEKQTVSRHRLNELGNAIACRCDDRLDPRLRLIRDRLERLIYQCSENLFCWVGGNSTATGIK